MFISVHPHLIYAVVWQHFHPQSFSIYVPISFYFAHRIMHIVKLSPLLPYSDSQIHAFVVLFISFTAYHNMFCMTVCLSPTPFDSIIICFESRHPLTPSYSSEITTTTLF
eukprot:869353_1